MPDNLAAFVVRLLEQGNGEFSKRAIIKGFNDFPPHEISKIENEYKTIFM